MYRSVLDKKSRFAVLAVVILMLLLWVQPAASAETLKLSTSAQVYEAFQGASMEKFTALTGVTVEIFVTTSTTAVNRLVNGQCDLAATALSLDSRLRDEGYKEYPFARDSLAVITNASTPVMDLTVEQLRGIMAGLITNWNQVGGPDRDMVIIVPSPETASYKHFSRLIMGGLDIKYDIMTAQSTAVVEATRRFPGSISFINQGATAGRPEGTKLIKVDGVGPNDPNYPYTEVFSLITKGEPTGNVKKFLDFAYSSDAKTFITGRGMKPYQE